MCACTLLATSQDANEGSNASDDVAGIRCWSLPCDGLGGLRIKKLERALDFVHGVAEGGQRHALGGELGGGGGVRGDAPRAPLPAPGPQYRLFA